MATAWTNDSKNSTTWTDDSASDIIGGVGFATGLIAPPTYASAIDTTTWTNDSKNTTSWTNDAQS